jgi:hypothetical protein
MNIYIESTSQKRGFYAIGTPPNFTTHIAILKVKSDDVSRHKNKIFQVSESQKISPAPITFGLLVSPIGNFILMFHVM